MKLGIPTAFLSCWSRHLVKKSGAEARHGRPLRESNSAQDATSAWRGEATPLQHRTPHGASSTARCGPVKTFGTGKCDGALRGQSLVYGDGLRRGWNGAL